MSKAARELAAAIKEESPIGVKAGNVAHVCTDEALIDAAVAQLLEIIEAAFEWIDAVPDDVVLPAMPGMDRDRVNETLEPWRY